MHVGGALITNNPDQFWWRVLSFFVKGAIIGAITGPLLARIQKKTLHRRLHGPDNGKTALMDVSD
jgi:hypothetical protein